MNRKINRIRSRELRASFAMSLFSAIVVIVGVVGISSCSSTEGLGESPTSEDRFRLAKGAFDSEDYRVAITHFETLLLQDPASEWADDAQFYLAESYYKIEEYFTAAFQFSRVLSDFRGSPYSKRALFKTGECYFEVSPKYHRDQKRTERAISQFEAFVGYYPDDSLTSIARSRIEELQDKLAHRDFAIAEGYFNRDEFEAASIYYRRVIKNYPNSIWASESTSKLAKSESLRKNEI